MYENISTPPNNAAPWHYLGTKQLNFRHENDSTLGVPFTTVDAIWRPGGITHLSVTS